MHSRQQTSRIATPTVTRTAITFAWDANQWITLCIKRVYLKVTRINPSDSPHEPISGFRGRRPPAAQVYHRTTVEVPNIPLAI